MQQPAVEVVEQSDNFGLSEFSMYQQVLRRLDLVVHVELNGWQRETS